MVAIIWQIKTCQNVEFLPQSAASGAGAGKSRREKLRHIKAIKVRLWHLKVFEKVSILNRYGMHYK